MRTLAPLAAVALMVATAACSLPSWFGRGSGPAAFTTKVCGVELQSPSGSARLRLTLIPQRALPQGALVQTEFQNPLERSVLTTHYVASGNEREITLVSPPFSDLRARRYETVTRIYASAERKRVIGSHTQICESLLDGRDLPGYRP